VPADPRRGVKLVSEFVVARPVAVSELHCASARQFGCPLHPLHQGEEVTVACDL
jgi:hypothetical protein